MSMPGITTDSVSYRTGNGDINHSAPPGDESDDDHGDVDHDIVLDIVLPDGTTKQMTVNTNIPMMDLLVHAAASSRLSPVSHVLVVRDVNGQIKEFRPNQSIGSLGVDAVYLQPKGTKMDKKPTKSDAQPFEITNRLIISLPQNQKMVLRVSLQTKLSEIFTIICSEKGLDSFIHELRHPKQYDLELDLDKTLQEYNLHEIKVVNIKAPLSYRGSDDEYSIHSSTNTSEILPPSIHVPPLRIAATVTSGQTRGSFSTEGEHKKKKGLKGLFKKKDKKAPKPPKGNSQNFHITQAPAQDSNFILRKRDTNQRHDPSVRHTMPPEAFSGDIHLHGDFRLEKPSDKHIEPSSPTTLNRTKKRHAPAPPPGSAKTNIEGSADIVTSEVGPMHQASKGMRRPSSPKKVSESRSINSLSASSGVSGSVDFKNEKRSQSVHDIEGAVKGSAPSPRLSVATTAALVANSKIVLKKKRRAPAPPQSPTTPTTPTQNGFTNESAPPKPPRAVSMFGEFTSLSLDVDRSKRPCSFIAPPPPDTPPPEDVPVVSLNGVITKSVSTSFSPKSEKDIGFDLQINGDASIDSVDGSIEVTSPIPSGDVEVNITGYDYDDDQSEGGTIDDVNLAFENVIAEAEKVMEDENVYQHQSEMARFVESMRDVAEDRAKSDVEFQDEDTEEVSIGPASDSDTVIHHGSEPQSEVSSSLDASGHITISFNTDTSSELQKVAVEPDVDVEEMMTQHIVSHEESAPNYSLDDPDVSQMDDHTDDVLAHSNVTADSGISQSYDRQADNFIEEIDSAFDSINFDLDGLDKMGPTTSVGGSNQKLKIDAGYEVSDTVSDIDTPPIGKGIVFETEYDGDISTENGAMDFAVTTSIDKTVTLESEPRTPRDKTVTLESEPRTPRVVTRARVESPVMVHVGSPRVESPTMVAVGGGMKPSSHLIQDSSPELPHRLVHESSPKDVYVQSKPTENASDSFGVKLRHTEPESNVVFDSDHDLPKAEEAMVKIRKKEKKIERISIVKPAPVRDSKVFTIGKDEEMFDFEAIRQRALAAQKEKKAGSVKHYGVAGSRPKSDVQKQTTEISFKPNGEGEAEHVLEEKSIMMMSRPKELKPVEVKVHEPDILHPKMVEPEPQSPQFKSAVNIKLGASSLREKHKPEMVAIGAQSSVKKHPEHVGIKRTSNHPAEVPQRPMSLGALMAANLPPKDDFELKHEQDKIPVIEHSDTSSEHSSGTRSTGTSDDDPVVKHQLDMLQAQFSDFQKQFQANQSLLTQQKILGRDKLQSDSDMSISGPTTPQPPASPSAVGAVKVAPIPVPPPFIIKADVKPVKSAPKKKFEKDLEPREELMIAIRNVGGRTALRKVPVRDTNWGVKVIK